MRPLPFVWPYALFFWAADIWAFLPEFRIVREARKNVRSEDTKDAGSFRLIVAGMQVAMAIAFPIAFLPSLRLPEAWQPALLVLGTAVLIAGSLLRRHCWKQLGASFTGDVRAAADQRIVTSGAYSILRHPSYTAGILMNVGVGLALGSWASLVVLVVSCVAVYAYRIRVEERALVVAVGGAYEEFMRTRWRLIPYVY